MGSTAEARKQDATGPGRRGHARSNDNTTTRAGGIPRATTADGMTDKEIRVPSYCTLSRTRRRATHLGAQDGPAHNEQPAREKKNTKKTNTPSRQTNTAVPGTRGRRSKKISPP
ncbi:hypothetical protein JDV02_004478 [Purpureocillium takamizusanense]|uniref:Uncharacterized protein n=1 Tax=Purpureocillium takamizusanense TaxID=2060973 RepID=A0A9Q8QG04_9HYPO|nr:uncharacterized protein JDV02_004478 [Purpureocillium takamizusanense]UNI18194.1 hypothetical protein JDV02_004478 [Purpureocillium takamizusanense]